MTATVRPAPAGEGGGGDHPDVDHETLSTVIADLATEQTTRGDADTALDIRLDTIEALGSLATDAEVAAAVAAHAGLADPHPVYLTPAEGNAAYDAAGAATAAQAAASSALSTHGTSGVHTAPQPPIIGSTATTAVAGNDARLTDTRTPTDASVTPAKFAASAVDPAAGVAGARTLGTGAQQAAAGTHTHAGSGANVVTAQESTDFTQAGSQATFTQLGTIAPSITLAAGSRLLVLLAGSISTSASDALDEMRLSIDSGATFVQLGRLGGDAFGINLAGHEVIAGLSAGAHTVKVEYKKAGGGTLYLRGSTQPQIERFRITLQEIP